MIKECEICGKSFEVNGKSSSRKYCFECSPSYSKIGGKSKTISAIRKAMKKQAVKLKGGKCEICGYDKSIRALSFHHLDPNEKEFSIAKDGYCYSWDKVLEEIDKCILVCANCHAEIHDKLCIEEN